MPQTEPQRIRVLGVDTHDWVYGDPEGDPIVLVHGFRGDHHGLEGIALALAETAPGLAIHVPDLPGFGESPAIPSRTHDLALYGEWLCAFAREVAPDGHTILGHSFGSLVVSNALHLGLPASRAILINPIASPALEGPQAALTQAAILYYRTADILPERAARALLGNRYIVRGMSEVMAKTGDRELRSWIHSQHHEYFSTFSDSTTLLDAFRASVSHTVQEFASAFTMPTLLIAGERDDITPLHKQLDLQRTLPHAQLQIFPGTGHLIHYEAVGDAVAAISEFLRGAEAVSSPAGTSTRAKREPGERTA